MQRKHEVKMHTRNFTSPICSHLTIKTRKKRKGKLSKESRNTRWNFFLFCILDVFFLASWGHTVKNRDSTCDNEIFLSGDASDDDDGGDHHPWVSDDDDAGMVGFGA